MISDHVLGLVTSLEDASYMCGLESGKQKGFVAVKTLSKPIIVRAQLLRELDDLFRRADLWASREKL